MKQDRACFRDLFSDQPMENTCKVIIIVIVAAATVIVVCV